MQRSLEADKFMALLHDLLREAHEDGVEVDAIIDGLICGFVTVGIYNKVEPEAVFWELRERWSTARRLHNTIVSGH